MGKTRGRKEEGNERKRKWVEKKKKENETNVIGPCFISMMTST
jgi:hypothetical protein